MSKKRISRRDFLNLSAGAAAASVLAACGATPETIVETVEVEKEVTVVKEVEKEVVKEVEKEVVVTATPEPEAEAPMGEQVVLEIGASNPEYENAERQIWDIYEAENPNVKVELFSVNEDTQAAFQAKIAGGWTPAFGPSYAFITGMIGQDTYEQFVDLSTIKFDWWDRFQHDPLHTVPELFGYGPRVINPFAGFVFTWMYHKDLMEEAGLNPREDVKTWDDLLAWIQAGTDWANSNPDVDFFWDQAWHNWVVGYNYMRATCLGFPDGQQDFDRQCFAGEKAFNDPDSPYIHTFEFFKEATDKGWIPENWWTREWETDMEASYIAKKSVMMYHGPWPWDKMLAADPTAQQEGIPLTPPAEGQETWMQYLSPPQYDTGGGSILIGALDKPEWPEIEKAFNWYHSPDVIAMRAEILGTPPLYDLDQPLELSGPQWLGIRKEIATPGGYYEDVEYTLGLWGELVAEPKRKGGTPGAWDWESGGNQEYWAKVMTGDMSIQEALDLVQSNWEASYDL